MRGDDLPALCRAVDDFLSVHDEMTRTGSEQYLPKLVSAIQQLKMVRRDMERKHDSDVA